MNYVNFMIKYVTYKINNKNYYHRRNYIKNKIYNIINYYNIQFIDDYVLKLLWLIIYYNGSPNKNINLT